MGWGKRFKLKYHINCVLILRTAYDKKVPTGEGEGFIFTWVGPHLSRQIVNLACFPIGFMVVTTVLKVGQTWC